jgi:cytochrome c biogenesis protein CcmG/thiol:disulfide interchange protein DsbE
MLAPDTTNTTEATALRRRRILMLLPLAGFLALALLFAIGLRSGDPSRIPSALIGHAVPAVALPPVPGLERGGRPVPGMTPNDFLGSVTLVNVWASWCGPCHDEAPLLLRLADDARIRLVGINYKDQAENARRFLGRHGNPFAANGADVDGKAGREWGVYGVPETFVVGRDGKIAFKLIGPITANNLVTELMPEIEKALGGNYSMIPKSGYRFSEKIMLQQ